MTPPDDKRRTAARCTRCGEIGIVRIWSDGTVKPIGQSDFCDCESATLRMLAGGENADVNENQDHDEE